MSSVTAGGATDHDLPRLVRPRLVRPGLVLEQDAPREKLLLLGDAAALLKALPDGVGIPLHPNTVVWNPGLGVCLWLRPNQRLLLLAPGDIPTHETCLYTSVRPASPSAQSSSPCAREFPIHPGPSSP